jgi:transposase-like protein
MTIDLTNPIFHDETAARKHVEAIRWPAGPVCTNGECKAVNEATELHGKSHRPGLYKCWKCDTQFTVLVGSIYEDSHIPLHKWLLATHIMCASKKSVSSLQIQRMLGLGSYRTAWHLCARIRAAMEDENPNPLGGPGTVVESDESWFGGKKKNRAYAKEEPKKQIVLTLVDRTGNSRSMCIPNVTAKTLKKTITAAVDRQSSLMTDEHPSYGPVGKQFAWHGSVNHSALQFAKFGLYHTNTAECRFSLMKRAVFGAHHSVSAEHLPLYLAEWDFKFNTRQMTDAERAALAVKGGENKRLMYRPPRKAAA